jgi:KipI family sensor histidine kinase inhibitor
MTFDEEFYGEDIITIGCKGTDMQAIAAALRASGVWEDVVPGMTDMTVKFDPDILSADEALARLGEQVEAVGSSGATQAAPPGIRLTTSCDGEFAPDATLVAKSLGVSPQELPAWLSQRQYRVTMMGFQPGFAYLEDLNGGDLPEIARLDAPRQRVAAGSIGILGGRVCIYALDGPGGWPIIGRVSQRLFDSLNADSPFLLKPGQLIKFEASDGE